MKPKKQKVKARKCWGYPAQIKDGSAWVTTKQQRDSQDARLFLLPGDAASYAQMVEQICKALWECAANGQTMRDDAIIALAAIGIKEPRQ